MKPTATLTNTACGGLADTDALADALSGRRLAGLDVFEGEPRISPRLLTLPNAMLAAPIGSGSLGTRCAMVSRAVDNLLVALGFGPAAGRPPNPISPLGAKAPL